MTYTLTGIRTGHRHKDRTEKEMRAPNDLVTTESPPSPLPLEWKIACSSHAMLLLK